MVKNILACINSRIVISLFNLFLLFSLPLISGCSVALSPLSSKEYLMYYDGDYEKTIQYFDNGTSLLSAHEKKRILDENIKRIKTNQETTFEFIYYRFDQEYLIKSLLATGEFDRALKLCDEGLKECEMFADLFKRYKYSPESPVETNHQLRFDLLRLKGYVIWFKTGDEDTAFKYFNKSMASDPSDQQYITFLDSLGKQKLAFLMDNAYFNDKILGKHREALAYFQQVVGLCDKLTLLDIDMQYGFKEMAYLRMMTIKMHLGELEEAKKELDKWNDLMNTFVIRSASLVVKNSKLYRGPLAESYSYAGALYALERDFETSKIYFDKALDVIKTIEPDKHNMFDRIALGTYYTLYGTYYCGLQSGKLEEAIENTDKGLNYVPPFFMADASSDLDIETAYRYSAELYFIKKDYATAKGRALKALEYALKKQNKVAAAAAHTILGQIYYAKNEKSAARQEYEKALRIAEHHGNESTDDWKLYYGLGQVYEDSGDKTGALKYYGDAVREVEKLWSGRFKDTVKQVSFIDDRLIVFEPMIRILHAQKNDKEAVRYMEMSKARTFYEASPFYPAEAGKNIEAWSPVKPMSINDLRASVSDTTAILEYYVGARSVMAAIITKKEVHIEELKIDNLQKKIIAFNLYMANPDYEYPTERGIELYAALVAPFTKYLAGYDSLCIIPHGVLHYLPFQALITGKDTSSFLIDKYKVFYAPSLTILNTVYKSNRTNKVKLLAVANSLEVDVKDLNLGKDTLPRLANVIKEAREVGQLFDDTNKTIIVDDKATKTTVSDTASAYDILLFSTHGLMVSNEPLKSCIFLSKDNENNGRLSVDDIEKLKLNSNLVILSACETGLVSSYAGNGDDNNPYDTRFPLGDDLAGLQRAFMKAGSASILSTLWSVNDTATKSFIVDFVKHYKGGDDKISALQTAALNIKSTEKWKHPYYWAAFILSGDWR